MATPMNRRNGATSNGAPAPLLGSRYGPTVQRFFAERCPLIRRPFDLTDILASDLLIRLMTRNTQVCRRLPAAVGPKLLVRGLRHNECLRRGTSAHDRPFRMA